MKPVPIIRQTAWGLALACGGLMMSGQSFAAPGIKAADCAFFFDFQSLSADVRLEHGARHVPRPGGGALEFTTALQFAEITRPLKLDGVTSASVGGWFFLRRSGEQCFFFRGLPETGSQGERLFRPATNWVNFLLGTDQHGFFMGTINGNGSMPFPHVALIEPVINAWHQLVVTKTADGFQKFHHNGVLVHSDHASAWAPKVWPFRDTEPGAPVRLAMPLGGLIGEAWVLSREVTEAEVQADFETKRGRYHPALPGTPVELRTMNAHHAAGLWREPVTAQTWPKEQARIQAGVMKVLGPFPTEKVPLEPLTLSEEDCGTYVRRKVSFQVQPDDRMPAWLLVPKSLLNRPTSAKAPAIICFYGTTSGAGKDTTVGLSGPKPGTPPLKNRAFALDMVAAGFVALAPDYLRDGERVPKSGRPYDTTDFYAQFPDWSIHGKDTWDTQRAVDYLQTLPFVDGSSIGMVGHSYGGHSTIFTTALEPRIKAAVASGPVSDFLQHGQHWAVPKGGGSSQSLPAMRPYVLDPTLPLPVTFYEWTTLIAPRPLLVFQAVGERRPMEEENHAAVATVYGDLGASDRVRYLWCAGDHDFPPVARQTAVEWFRQWLRPGEK